MQRVSEFVQKTLGMFFIIVLYVSRELFSEKFECGSLAETLRKGAGIFSKKITAASDKRKGTFSQKKTCSCEKTQVI